MLTIKQAAALYAAHLDVAIRAQFVEDNIVKQAARKARKVFTACVEVPAVGSLDEIGLAERAGVLSGLTPQHADAE